MFEIGDLVVRDQDWRDGAWAKYCEERKLNVNDVFKVEKGTDFSLILQHLENLEWHSNKFKKAKVSFTIEEFL